MSFARARCSRRDRQALPASAIADAVLVTRIVRVSDGDTVHAMIDGRAVRVRLAAIDAAESAKPSESGRAGRWPTWWRVAMSSCAKSASTSTSALVVLSVEGISVNAELARLGWAWVYRQYSSDAALIALEGKARRSRWGLWADPHPVPPLGSSGATRAGAIMLVDALEWAGSLLGLFGAFFCHPYAGFPVWVGCFPCGELGRRRIRHRHRPLWSSATADGFHVLSLLGLYRAGFLRVTKSKS